VESHYHSLGRQSRWLVGAVLVLGMLLAGAVPVFAAPTIMPVTTCPTQLSSCTANDLVTTVSAAVGVKGDTCTDPSDTITIDMIVDWAPNSGTRYDVGFYIWTSGAPGNPSGNACVGSIAPIGAGEDPAPKVFADYDGQTGDICGDIQKGATTSPVRWAVRTTVQCTPAPGTNYLQVPACRVWDQQAGSVCTSLTDAGTGSKCDCTPLPVTDIPVPESAQITVVKHLLPTADLGLFTLFVDEGNNGTIDHQAVDQTNNGTLGPVTVPAGTMANPGATHSVGESAGTGTNLANYSSSITCVKVGGGTVGPAAGTSTTLAVQPNDQWTCTITNTRYGSVTIVKDTVPDDAQDFSFSATGGLSPATFTLDDDADPTLPNTQVFGNVLPGQYGVSETNPGFWRLYALLCSDPTNDSARDGTTNTAVINLAAGEDVTCTFYNGLSTAVDVKSFTATAGGRGQVALAWKTASEVDNLGFNLYRALTEDGERATLNGDVIASAAPGNIAGASYSFTDNVPLKRTVYYWLEAIGPDGSATLHGPVSVQVR
jgi:hypothetical protein